MDRSLESQDPSLDEGSQGGVEGGLKELVQRWFTETQAASLTQDGHFPNWFQGFANRKDAEVQLEEKAVGVFLIRLSEKAFGYVLSYKGEDRCRHFVISQSPEGQFSIAGDEREYPSLSALIEHFKVCPIEPFGEFLTNNEPDMQEDTADLYDMVIVPTKKTSGVSVQALRSIWDQKGAGPCRETPPRPPHAESPQFRNSAELAPALPPKSTRRLTSAVSVDSTELAQCTANKATSLGFLPTVSSLDQSNPQNNVALTGHEPPQTSPRTTALGVTYSSVVHAENRSISLPCLDRENKLSRQEIGSPTPAPRSKKVTCVTYSLHEPLSEALLRPNPLYETAGAQQEGSPYAEVQGRDPMVESPYEDVDLPKRDRDNRSNVYTSIEELRSRERKPNLGKNKNWKNFFTDYSKK